MNSNFENFESDNDDFDLEAALAACQFDEEDYFEEFDEDHDFNAALKESTQDKAINDSGQVNTLPNNRQIESD